MFEFLRLILSCSCTILILLSVGRVDAATCDDAATLVAGETGIPVNILRAITRVETGRRQTGQEQSWPWTVNFAGEGHFFDDKEQAVAFVQGLIDQGETVIDIGCFQMNLKWHSDRFQSLEDMFDPATNARAAAEFLLQLYDETGGWEQSVGLYHSRTPEKSATYVNKVAKVLAMLTPDELVEAPNKPLRARTMTIRYPYLQGGQPSMPGSLVPTLDSGSPMIGG